MENKTHIREIILNTEVTGFDLDKGERLIEIACVELIDHQPTGKTYHTYLNPEKEMSQEVIDVHGLTNEFLQDKPLFADIVDDFLSFIGTDSILIAHHATFDMRFINTELQKCNRPTISDTRVVDTLLIARNRFPNERVSLSCLCDRFQIKPENSHDTKAMQDCKILTQVYLCLFDNFTTESYDLVIPLFLAEVSKGSVYDAEKLFLSGADIHVTDGDGRNAIYYALHNGHVNMLDWLLRRGFFLDYTDPLTGRGALHIAANKGQLLLIHHLIHTYHLNVNAPDETGKTPLEVCLENTQMATACYLILNGAKYIKNMNHKNALVKYLKQRVSDLSCEKESAERNIKRAKKNEGHPSGKPFNEAKEKAIIEQRTEQITRLNEFIRQACPTSPKKVPDDLLQKTKVVLEKLGITEKEEVSFYLATLSKIEQELLIALHRVNPEDDNIRWIIWQNYLSNWVTRFFLTDHNFLPAYIMGFEEDTDILPEKISPSLINGVRTRFPRFGRDYYLVRRCKTPTWISLPSIPFLSPFTDICFESGDLYCTTKEEAEEQSVMLHFITLHIKESVDLLRQHIQVTHGVQDEPLFRAANNQSVMRRISKIEMGIPVLDKMTGGLKAGELTLIAGKPYDSALAFAAHCAKQAMAQSYSPYSQVGFFCSIIETESDACRFLPDTFQFIKGVTILADLCAQIVQQVQTNGTNLIVIDNLQAISYHRKPEASENDDTLLKLKKLKQLAMDYQVAILALSELNDTANANENRRPYVTEIKLWPHIQTADTTLLLYLEERYIEFDEPHQQGNESKAQFSQRLDAWTKRCIDVENECEIVICKPGGQKTITCYCDIGKGEFDSLLDRKIDCYIDRDIPQNV